MNVGCILIVTICVSQCFWPTVGLKLSLSNVSSKSSPTLKNSTLPSSSVSSPFVSKTSTSVDQPESTSNIGNAFNSPSFRNRFPPKPLSSLPASSSSLFTGDSVNTEALKPGSSEIANLKTNNNILSTIRNSLNKQNNNLSPQSTSLGQSFVTNDLSFSKIEEPSTKSSNNNILSSFHNKPLQSNTVDKNNLLLNQPHVESLSTNDISPSIGSLKPKNLQNNLQKYNQNKINNNLKQNLPAQGCLDSKLAGSYKGPRTNLNPFPQSIGPLQSNILTNTQNIEQADLNGITTKKSAFDPSLSILPNFLRNNQQQTANQASNSLIQNDINSGSLLSNNLANKIASESSPSVKNPNKKLTATAQTDIANRIPSSLNNNLISKFNKNLLLQQLNTNLYDNNILNNDLPAKNMFPNSISVNNLQNNELQINNIENYLALQNRLASRVTPDTTHNILPVNTVLGQNNLINNNNQNILSKDDFINNANLQSPTLPVYPYNIQNSVNLESTSTIPNDIGIHSNTLPNALALTQPNYYNSISQLPVPITPNFPEGSIPLYSDNSSSNILQQANVKSSPQLSTFPPNNLIYPYLLQTINPLVEFQSPNILPGSLNINSGSYLPTSNLDLINTLNILDSVKPETLYSLTYPEYLKNANSISKLPSFPQNTNLNSQFPFKNNMELSTPYISLNSNPYLSSTPQEIYDYLYPPIDTSIYKNTVFTESISDDQNNNSKGSTESIETEIETSSISPYSIPSISNLPNVNGLTLPQALLYNNISPSDLVVPQIENLLSTNDLTDSIINLGNDVARRYIDYLWAKKAKPAYTPSYNPVFPIPNSFPPIAETFVPSPNVSPSIIPITSPSPIVPLSVASIPPPVIDVVKEDEQSNQFIYPSLSTTRIQNDESQGFFQPTFFPTDLSVFTPSVLPTPTINYPVYPPYIPTPPINFPPIPPLFPPIPSIIEMPVLKMGSGCQDSRKWIEILLLASLLNNNDCCNDRGALETLIALMWAT